MIVDDMSTGKNAYIFKQPMIESFTINHSNNLQDLYWLDGKYESHELRPDITAEIRLRMSDIGYQSASKIKPEDLYSLPELIKMSKMITRKIKM